MPLNFKSGAFVGIVSEIPEFIEATGGVETFDGDYKIHTFNGDGLLQLTAGSDPTFGNKVEYLVIAGGGGGADDLAVLGGGGAGAGGMLEGTNHTVSTQGYPITVGAGGVGVDQGSSTDGGDSIFDTFTSVGGGSGGCGRAAICNGAGRDGGSGGGNGNSDIPGLGIVGQGNNGGGPSIPTAGTAAGGGGGKGGVGQPGYFASIAPQGHSLYNGGDGGLNATNSITGSPVDYCGGGGGGASSFASGGASGGAGAGAGGNAGQAGFDATPNTGSGGGGCGRGFGGGTRGGHGAAGVVIIRYKFQ